MTKPAKLTKRLRNFRVYHRYFGLIIALLVLISALTGILLALKKDIDVLQPPTQKGASKDLATWKSVEELAEIAQLHFYSTYPEQEGNEIERMDIRPSKGIVKVLF